MNEVDLIIHYMRQSKMDSVRKELGMLIKLRDSFKPGTTPYTMWNAIISEFSELFKRASNNAPLP